MGFYSPHSLVQDARRHGVPVATPDLNRSGVHASLEGPPGRPPPPGAPPERWGAGGPTVRLGLASVRGIGVDLAERIVAGAPYRSPEDLARRVHPPAPVLEALATAGAFDTFGLDRRSALWTAGAVAAARDDRLEGVLTGVDAPALPGLSDRELAMADLWATGVAPDGHPTRFVREHLDHLGVATAAALVGLRHGTKVTVGGVVTHRQRPATASGTTFVNLEDETGLVNVVVSVGCWERHRPVARGAPALLVRGRLERGDGGVVNVIAERIEPLPLSGAVGRSRDFR